jgi:hypothetical protein
VGVFFKHNANQNYDENNFETENEGRYTLYIAEEKLQECPRITIKIGEEEVSAILDTGCELTIMDKNLCDKIKQRQNKYLELPAQHLLLVSTFNDKSWRVKRQIILPVKLGTVSIDHVFLVSPQLLTSVILGTDFFINTSAIINFPERCAVFQVDNETRHSFDVVNNNSAITSCNSATGCTGKDVCRVSILPLAKSSSLHIEFTTNKEHCMFASGNSTVFDNEGSTGCRGSHAMGFNVCCHEYETGSQSLEVCNDDVAAAESLGMQNESSVPVSSTAKGNERHKDGKLIHNDGENINVHVTQNTAINCFRTINGDTSISVTNDKPDDRVNTSTQLRAKISEYDDLSVKCDR